MTQETTTKLVHRNNIEATVLAMVTKEKEVVEELEKILPNITLPSIKSGLELRLKKSLEIIGALEAGYLPVETGWFSAVDSKSKWVRKDVEEALRTMPEEIKEAWKRAEQLGVFTGFFVSRRGGDPMIVGKAGQKAFLIGAWVNFQGGYSCGFRFMPNK